MISIVESIVALSLPYLLYVKYYQASSGSMPPPVRKLLSTNPIWGAVGVSAALVYCALI